MAGEEYITIIDKDVRYTALYCVKEHSRNQLSTRTDEAGPADNQQFPAVHKQGI